MTKAKVQEREKAIEMRKNGASYKDILKVLPVAKSSLSLWLKDLPLTDDEKAVLKKRRDSNISKGRIRAASSNRRNRLNREREAFKLAKVEFENFKKDPLFMVGVSLYWAEGAKRSSSFSFMNSDPEMIKLMIAWCERFLKPEEFENIYLRLYIHKPYAHENCEEYWAKVSGISLDKFKNTVYKPSGLGVKKRPGYRGCLRIEVAKGMHLLRKMQYFQQLLVASYSQKVV